MALQDYQTIPYLLALYIKSIVFPPNSISQCLAAPIIINKTLLEPNKIATLSSD